VLEATLRLFLNENTLLKENRTLAMFCIDPERLRQRAEQIVAALKPEQRQLLRAQVRASNSQAGSGALPLEQIPSYAIVLRPSGGKIAALGAKLRQAAPPVIGHVQDDCLYLDMRTVLEEELPLLTKILNSFRIIIFIDCG